MDENNIELTESNARIVRWSDGSLSLHLGSEIFDVHQMSLQVKSRFHLVSLEIKSVTFKRNRNQACFSLCRNMRSVLRSAGECFEVINVKHASDLRSNNMSIKWLYSKAYRSIKSHRP